MIIQVLNHFSSQFIIRIYLHHLIEWFALTNLISEIDRKAKHSRFGFLNVSSPFFPGIQHSHTHTHELAILI